ncbi:MAG: hypothetical protein LCI00_28465 [Chloroflexi bacterium]|nr:hypothetical protein [Chloroflexota bacterium]MCC6894469.1 hypothetical protein [Anaerolineae bacterium]
MLFAVEFWSALSALVRLRRIKFMVIYERVWQITWLVSSVFEVALADLSGDQHDGFSLMRNNHKHC